MRKRAFTLIELLVVIAIIGILATIVIINVASARTKANESKASAEISEANKIVSLCKANGVGTVNAPDTSFNGTNTICQGDTSITGVWPNLTETKFSYGGCTSPITEASYSCTATNTTTHRQITFTNTGVGSMVSISAGSGSGTAVITLACNSAGGPFCYSARIVTISITLGGPSVGTGSVALAWTNSSNTVDISLPAGSYFARAANEDGTENSSGQFTITSGQSTNVSVSIDENLW